MEAAEHGDFEKMEAMGAQIAIDFMESIAAMEFAFHVDALAVDSPMTQAKSATIGEWLRYNNTDGEVQLNAGVEIKETYANLPPVAPAELIPHSLRFEVDVSRIPSSLFADVANAAIQGNEEMLPFIAMQAIFGAASRVQINDSYVLAPEASIDITLDAEANAEAAFSAMGELTIQIHGMDKIMATLADLSPDVSAGFAMFLAMSDRQEIDGKTVDVFQLTLGKDGTFLLNGKDLSPMLQQFMR